MVFTFERAGLICQDLTKSNTVYVFFFMASNTLKAGEYSHICATCL